MKFTLKDESSDKKINLRVEFDKNGNHFVAFIFAEGYGDSQSQNGHGSPIGIEFSKGELKLLVWSDINKEENTHEIDLSGALESNRIE